MSDKNDSELIRKIFDSIPSLVFVVDEDVRVQEYNAAAAEFLLVERIAILKYGVDDIRRFFENNMRFLSQF